MERRGERTDRGENNRDIQAENVGREREARRLDKQVADDFDAKKWPPRQTDRIIQEMEASRAGLGRQREAWRLEREAIAAPGTGRRASTTPSMSSKRKLIGL